MSSVDAFDGLSLVQAGMVITGSEVTTSCRRARELSTPVLCWLGFAKIDEYYNDAASWDGAATCHCQRKRRHHGYRRRIGVEGSTLWSGDRPQW